MMYSYSDDEATLESSLMLDEYTAGYMQYGFDFETAEALALFDLTTDLFVKNNGFSVDYEKFNIVQ